MHEKLALVYTEHFFNMEDRSVHSALLNFSLLIASILKLILKWRGKEYKGEQPKMMEEMTSEEQVVTDKVASAKIADELQEAAQTNVTQGWWMNQVT